jgi:lysophospholipase L1-like esterase
MNRWTRHFATSRCLVAALVLMLSSLVAAQDARPKRIACVGDSITYGAGVEQREVNNYPAQLGRMLGEGYQVRNFGVSGATLLKQGDKPYIKQKAYTDALEFKPDIVIIKLGTNDTKPQNWKHKDQYAADYKDLIADFRKANPDVKVYTALPVPAFPGNWGISDETIKGEVIPLAKQVAEETKATVIDLYTPMAGRKEFFPDKVHPNKAGATAMTKVIYTALTGKEAPVGE